MNLIKYLQAQGIGSRRQCQWLVQNALIQINGGTQSNAKAEVRPETVQSLTVDGEEAVVIPLPDFYILLNKPAGYETSHKPRDYPSVFSLLPDQVRAADIQAVGRLDADTTGVLLITNDGQFKHAADPSLCAQLQAGVLLHDDNETVSAQAAELHDAHTLILTIREGKYHQVKRMVAAAGNRVEHLHRLQFGPWDTQDLQAGEWRFIRVE